MISPDFRFEGFDERSWLRALSLLGVSSGKAAARKLIVVVDGEDRALTAFTTDGEPLPTSSYRGRAEFGQVCAELGVAHGLVVREGAIDFIVEQAATHMPMPGDYAAQWLALLGILRRAEQAGALLSYPAQRRPPVPAPAVLERALDLVLPNGKSLVVAVYDGPALWSALVLRRRNGALDLLAGPRAITSWTGPLGGDYRRDHRTIRAAVGRNAAPVHLGIFAQREQLTELLRDPWPGAWAAAFATRDVVVEPAPAYIGVAAVADAGRAVTGALRELLGGVDLLASAAPLAGYAREQLGQVGRVSSLTGMLGFNPLDTLAERLRAAPPDDAP